MIATRTGSPARSARHVRKSHLAAACSDVLRLAWGRVVGSVLGVRPAPERPAYVELGLSSCGAGKSELSNPSAASGRAVSVEGLSRAGTLSPESPIPRVRPMVAARPGPRSHVSAFPLDSEAKRSVLQARAVLTASLCADPHPSGSPAWRPPNSTSASARGSRNFARSGSTRSASPGSTS